MARKRVHLVMWLSLGIAALASIAVAIPAASTGSESLPDALNLTAAEGGVLKGCEFAAEANDVLYCLDSVATTEAEAWQVYLLLNDHQPTGEDLDRWEVLARIRLLSEIGTDEAMALVAELQAFVGSVDEDGFATSVVTGATGP